MNVLYCTGETLLHKRWADMTYCIYCPGGSTSLHEVTSWPPS